MRITTRLATGLLALSLLAACSDDDTPVASGDDPSGTDTTDRVDDAGEVPARAPELVGVITSLQPFVPITDDCTPPGDLDPDDAVSSDDPPVCTPEDSDVVGTVLVEEDPDDPQAGRKISFTVTSESTITGEGPDGIEVRSFGDLAEGQLVDSWVSGDACAESYPEMCGLEAIRVTG